MPHSVLQAFISHFYPLQAHMDPLYFFGLYVHVFLQVLKRTFWLLEPDYLSEQSHGKLSN